MPGNDTKRWILAVVGLLLGAAVGYFYRPPAFLVGQLPFHVVITRGTTLKGLDQVYIPVAESSFNYLLAGAVLGAVVGYLVGWRLERKPAGD